MAGGDASEEEDEDDAPSHKKAKGTVEEEEDTSHDDMDVELSAQVMATTVAGEGGEERSSTGRPRAESVNRIEAPSDKIVEAPHQAGPPPSQVASAADRGGLAATKKKKKKGYRSKNERGRHKRRDNNKDG